MSIREYRENKVIQLINLLIVPFPLVIAVIYAFLVVFNAPTDHSPVNVKFVKSLANAITFSGGIFILGALFNIPAYVIFWTLQGKKKLESLGFIKTKYIKPIHLNLHYSYLKPFIERKEDELIVDSLKKDNRAIILVGSSLYGKNRLIYEKLSKELSMPKNSYFLPPDNFKRIIHEDKLQELFDLISKKNKTIILLEDLEKLNLFDFQLNFLLNLAHNQKGNVIILAWCSEGGYEVVKRNYVRSLEKMSKIHLTELIPQNKAVEFLRKDLNLSEQEINERLSQFDGTPGSLILGLERRKQQLLRLNDEAGNNIILNVYESLRLLFYCIGLSEVSESYIKRFCKNLVLSKESRNSFDLGVNILVSNSFIRRLETENYHLILPIHDSLFTLEKKKCTSETEEMIIDYIEKSMDKDCITEWDMRILYNYWMHNLVLGLDHETPNQYLKSAKRILRMLTSFENIEKLPHDIPYLIGAAINNGIVYIGHYSQFLELIPSLYKKQIEVYQTYPENDDVIDTTFIVIYNAIRIFSETKDAKIINELISYFEEISCKENLFSKRERERDLYKSYGIVQIIYALSQYEKLNEDHVNNLRKITEMNKNDIEFQELLASGLYNMMLNYSKNEELRKSHIYLDEMKNLSENYEKNIKIQTLYSNGLFQLINVFGSKNMINKVESLIEDLRILAKDQSENVKIQLNWINIIKSSVNYFGEQNQVDKILSFLEDLSKLDRKNEEISENLSEAFVIVLFYINNEKGLEKIPIVLELLHTINIQFPQNESIRISLAKGIVNAIVNYGRKDSLTSCNNLLDELRDFAHDINDKIFKEILARALQNILTEYITIRDKVNTFKLFAELKLIFSKNPNNSETRNYYALSLRNLITSEIIDQKSRLDFLNDLKNQINGSNEIEFHYAFCLFILCCGYLKKEISETERLKFQEELSELASSEHVSKEIIELYRRSINISN